jgi:hypothetical protein
MTAVEKRDLDRVGVCLCKTIRRTKRAFPPEFAMLMNEYMWWLTRDFMIE